MKQLRSDAYLLIAAVIWGTAFVAQSVSMDFIGPFLFGATRFALGGLVLLVPAFLRKGSARPETGSMIKAGLATGGVLFVAASFQQFGIQYTSIGKAGFVTCLYIVIVPLASMFFGHKTGKSVWAGCAAAVAGLWLLCIRGGFSVNFGDFLEFIGAFVWSAHILLIDRYAKRVDVLQLACTQFFACSAFNFLAVLIFEPLTLSGLSGALPSIAYAGIVSVGVAYTLQVVAQKYSPPSHAAIILSLETVFAVLSGWFILGERLDAREITGCILMLAGMLISQLGPLFGKKRA